MTCPAPALTCCAPDTTCADTPVGRVTLCRNLELAVTPLQSRPRLHESLDLLGEKRSVHSARRQLFRGNLAPLTCCAAETTSTGTPLRRGIWYPAASSCFCGGHALRPRGPLDLVEQRRAMLSTPSAPSGDFGVPDTQHLIWRSILTSRVSRLAQGAFAGGGAPPRRGGRSAGSRPAPARGCCHRPSTA